MLVISILSPDHCLFFFSCFCYFTYCSTSPSASKNIFTKISLLVVSWCYTLWPLTVIWSEVWQSRINISEIAGKNCSSQRTQWFWMGSHLPTWWLWSDVSSFLLLIACLAFYSAVTQPLYPNSIEFFLIAVMLRCQRKRRIRFHIVQGRLHSSNLIFPRQVIRSRLTPRFTSKSTYTFGPFWYWCLVLSVRTFFPETACLILHKSGPTFTEIKKVKVRNFVLISLLCIF